MLTLEDEKWLQPNVRGGMLVDLAKYTNTVKKKIRGMGTSSKENKKIKKKKSPAVGATNISMWY